MSDSLFDGRSFRILTRVDGHSRESLAMVPRPSFRAQQVVEILNGLIQTRGKPHAIRCDNGPEFAGRVLDQWAYWNDVELDFSRPGKPTDNASIEAFNARLRAECLNAFWFLSLHDARDRLESWRHDDNTARPHSALGQFDAEGLCAPRSRGQKNRIEAGSTSGAGPRGQTIADPVDQQSGTLHTQAAASGSSSQFQSRARVMKWKQSLHSLILNKSSIL